ncbi:MAG: hypothetical protein RLZZ428_593 [Pseudomonadota bacterium]
MISQCLSATEQTWLNKIDGSLRFGYQHGAEGTEDVALGGKIHLQTNPWQGISAGASVYTTNAIGSHEGAGIVFFDSQNDSYSRLGEVYLEMIQGKTGVKVGRQQIDTPYADTDDNGMILNRFEGAILTNHDIDNFLLTAAYMTKMAGVDAALPETFTDMGMDKGMLMAGISYEGVENMVLQGWIYDIKESIGDSIFTYADAVYAADIENHVSYEIAVQYTTQETFAGDSTIYGVSGSLNIAPIGVTLLGAYNQVDGMVASNGFGGGPFYTSSEHLTLTEGGDNATAFYLSGEFDAGVVGMEGLTFLGGYFKMDSAAHTSAKELDYVVSYAASDRWSFDLFFSDIKDKINHETYQNTRFFVNYLF